MLQFTYVDINLILTWRDIHVSIRFLYRTVTRDCQYYNHHILSAFHVCIFIIFIKTHSGGMYLCFVTWGVWGEECSAILKQNGRFCKLPRAQWVGSDPSHCWQLSCCGTAPLNWIQSGFKYDLWALFTKLINTSHQKDYGLIHVESFNLIIYSVHFEWDNREII